MDGMIISGGLVVGVIIVVLVLIILASCINIVPQANAYIISKDEAISNFDFERKMKQAQNIIENLYNDNVELSENENMKQIMQDFKEIDEKLTAGISYYNKKTNPIERHKLCILNFLFFTVLLYLSSLFSIIPLKYE